MNERKPRKHDTAQEKIAILRRHLVEKVPVSDLCEQYQLQPTGSSTAGIRICSRMEP
jgi:hypothetical protein